VRWPGGDGREGRAARQVFRKAAGLRPRPGPSNWPPKHTRKSGRDSLSGLPREVGGKGAPRMSGIVQRQMLAMSSQSHNCRVPDKRRSKAWEDSPAALGPVLPIACALNLQSSPELRIRGNGACQPQDKGNCEEHAERCFHSSTPKTRNSVHAAPKGPSERSGSSGHEMTGTAQE
jgi:hypothetical protein